MLRYDCFVPFSSEAFCTEAFFSKKVKEVFSKGFEGLEEYGMIVSNVSVLEELRALKQGLQDSL